jgi:hypothetical protein
LENLPVAEGTVSRYRLGAMHASILVASSGGKALECRDATGHSTGVRLEWRLPGKPVRRASARDRFLLGGQPVCLMGAVPFATSLADGIARHAPLACERVEDLEAAALFFQQHGAGTLVVDGDGMAPSSYHLARIRWMTVDCVRRLWIVFTHAWAQQWEVLREDHPPGASPLILAADLQALLLEERSPHPPSDTPRS